MPDRKKLAEMIALARLETGSMKEKLRLTGYFRSDYLALQLLRNVLSTTAAYGLIAALYAASHAEALLDRAVDMNFGIIVTDLLAGLILLNVITGILTVIFSLDKLRRTKREIEEYRRHMERLKEFM